MDWGTVFGFISAWVLFYWACALGVDMSVYWDIPSVILVVGGAFTTLYFCFRAGLTKALVGMSRKALFAPKLDCPALIDQLVSFAEIARRDGILSLESAVKELKDPFLIQGIRLAVDGTDPKKIEGILNEEVENLSSRQETVKAMLDNLGRYGPALGLIGTLIGLIIMLQNMDDPARVGPGMAVALITTVCGAMISNMITGPLGERMSRRSGEEVLYRTIVIKGVMSIRSGDNPNVVQQNLSTFLPPARRKALAEAA
jgi:chemotaxis protein MotA